MRRHNPLTTMKVNYGFMTDPKYRGHTGVDYAATRGTVVRAADAGKVRNYIGKNGGGNVVEITHANGDKSYYSHLDRWAVKNGTKVKAGDVIGFAGDSGNAKGVHLHMAVMRAGKWISPIKWLEEIVLPHYYRVATAPGVPLRGRKKPSLSAAIKVRRLRGHKLKIVRWVNGDGLKWGVTQFGTYYAAEFLKPDTK